MRAAALALIVLANALVPSATPSPPPAPTAATFVGQTTPDGITLTGERVTPEGRTSPGTNPGVPTAGPWPTPTPTFEYRTVVDCAGNSLDNPDGTETCYSAVRACAASPEGTGPQARLYRRIPGETDWTYVGRTCLAGTFEPPHSGAVTVADVQRAFEETPFAMPIGSTEPVGGATLVNLPTYFALTWSPTGYRPGQTRTLAMLGHTVDLRLVHGGHVYDFGDGTRLGPTPSPGGPYPTGDVTHTYRTAATLTPTATTTITADYRIDGGPWQRLPGQSTQTTAFPALTVFTASNRLRADAS